MCCFSDNFHLNSKNISLFPRVVSTYPPPPFNHSSSILHLNNSHSIHIRLPPTTLNNLNLMDRIHRRTRQMGRLYWIWETKWRSSIITYHQLLCYHNCFKWVRSRSLFTTTELIWLDLNRDNFVAAFIVQLFFIWRIWTVGPILELKNKNKTGVVLRYSLRVLCVLVTLVSSFSTNSINISFKNVP